MLLMEMLCAAVMTTSKVFLSLQDEDMKNVRNALVYVDWLPFRKFFRNMVFVSVGTVLQTDKVKLHPCSSSGAV